MYVVSTPFLNGRLHIDHALLVHFSHQEHLRISLAQLINRATAVHVRWPHVVFRDIYSSNSPASSRHRLSWSDIWPRYDSFHVKCREYCTLKRNSAIHKAIKIILFATVVYRTAYSLLMQQFTQMLLRELGY